MIRRLFLLLMLILLPLPVFTGLARAADPVLVRVGIFENLPSYFSAVSIHTAGIPVWGIWLLAGIGISTLLFTGHRYVLREIVKARTRDLTAEISKRKEVELHNSNLAAILQALRNVSQLIVREPDRKSLIQQTCRLLVETRGFYCAWIVLFDENGHHSLDASAEIDDPGDMTDVSDEAGYPACVKRFLADNLDFALCSDIDDQEQLCSIRDKYPHGEGLVSLMQYENQIYGVLAVYVPSEFARDPEEKALMIEMAGDIAFALHNIDESETREEAEKQIQGLAKFPDENPNPVLRIAFDGTILYANKAADFFLEHWGAERGCKVSAECYSFIENAVSTGELLWIEHEIGEKMYSCNIVPIMSSEYTNIYASDVTLKYQAEASLRESEERYRLLIDNITDAVLLTTPDGGIHAANPAACRMFGYTEEVLCRIGRDGITDLNDPRLHQLLDDRRAHGMAKGELRLIRKDGTVFPCEVTSVLFVDRDGVTKTSMTLKDITERKQYEEELNLRAMLLDSASDGICLFDSNGRYIYVNEMYCGMHGFTREDIRGMDIRQIDAAINHEWFEWLESELTLKGVVRFESNRRRKDGSVLVLGIHLTEIETGDATYYLSIERDITEQNRMENELRQSESKLSTTFDSIPQGVLVTDMEGQIMQVNRSAVVIYGCESEADILGRNALDFAEEAYHQAIIETINDSRKQNGKTSFRYIARKKDGTEFPAEMSVAPIAESSGTVTGFVGLFQDITEQQQMQENLMVTDRLASVGELAAGIAHELNNPLTGVIGFSDLLMLREDISEEVKEDLSIINREALRASQIARHLLTFARKHPDEKRAVNLNRVVQVVLELRAYEQRVNNIEVDTNLDESLPDVLANDYQLQQVFINIIINAEHFMIETNGRGRLDISSEVTGHTIRMTIADDGPGIEPEHLSRIFDPFFTTKEIGKGTGLGLSICYGIITEHSGRIWVESEPGKGARFIIELPVYTEFTV